MAFDPDEYLKEKDLEKANKSTSGFDPDAYLKNPTTTGGGANPIPQAVTVGKEVAGLVPEAVSAGGNLIKQGAQFVANRPIAATIADVGGVLTHGVPYGSMGNAAKNAIMGTGPTLGETVANAKNILAGGGGALAGGARAVGGAVARGLTAPESLLTLPYQMSAYEQEKIRANPGAPEYKTNPYAQQYRGEFPSQGAAGAANTRGALITQPYGGLTPQQQQMLEQDRQRQLDIQKQQQKKQQAQMILQQPPTAQNFIQRMTAMSDLYGDVNQG